MIDTMKFKSSTREFVTFFIIRLFFGVKSLLTN